MKYCLFLGNNIPLFPGKVLESHMLTRAHSKSKGIRKGSQWEWVHRDNSLTCSSRCSCFKRSVIVTLTRSLTLASSSRARDLIETVQKLLGKEYFDGFQPWGPRRPHHCALYLDFARFADSSFLWNSKFSASSWLTRLCNICCTTLPSWTERKASVIVVLVAFV